MPWRTMERSTRDVSRVVGGQHCARVGLREGGCGTLIFKKMNA